MYTPNTWVTGDVITATKLNNNETGTSEAHNASYSTATDATAEIISLPSSDIERSELKCVVKGNTQTPYDEYTKLLLLFEGTDASTTFTDQTGKTVTPSGDAQIDTAQYKYGSASGLFDGTGDYLTVADSASNDLDIGTQDFCIEGWFRFGSVATTKVLFDFRQSADSDVAPTILLDSAILKLHVGGSNKITGTTTFVKNTWYHIAVAKSSGVTKLFVNGGQEGSSYTDAHNYIAVTSIHMGIRYDETIAPFNGWMDEVRISVGTPRYTANFIPLQQTVLSTERVEITSVGKNLFDKSNYNNKYYVKASDGTLVASASYFSTDYIKVKPSTAYAFNKGVNSATAGIAWYDANKTYISGEGITSATSYTKTSPSNAYYVRVCSNDTYATIDNYQVEVGSSATTYEAYKSTTVQTPVILRSVSSTIYDTFDVQTGIHMQNVSAETTLSGNAFTWSFGADYTGFKRFTITLASLTNCTTTNKTGFKGVKYNNKELSVIDFQNVTPTTGDLIGSNTSVLSVTASDTDTGWDESWVSGTSFTGMTWANLIKAYMNGWKLTTANVDVASCVWTGITSGTTKTGASGYNDVIANIDVGFTPYKMLYQLATPTQTNYPPQVLQAHVSGAVTITDIATAGTIPTVEYSYATTIKGQNDDNSDMIMRLQDKVDDSRKGASIYAASSTDNDTYVVTLYPALDELNVGQVIHFMADVANTGACTLNANGLGAKSIKKNVSADLADGDIQASQTVTVIYDGTNFQLISAFDFLRGILTTAGDTVYANANNTPARLAKGTAYQIKRMNSGATAPEWATDNNYVSASATILLSADTERNQNAVAEVTKKTFTVNLQGFYRVYFTSKLANWAGYGGSVKVYLNSVLVGNETLNASDSTYAEHYINLPWAYAGSTIDIKLANGNESETAYVKDCRVAGTVARIADAVTLD